VILEDSLTGIQVNVGDDDRLWSALRVSPPTVIIFAVEDDTARSWLYFLLSAIEFPHIEVMDIWNVGGESEVRKAASMPAPSDATFHVYGFLDGDQRDRGKEIEGRLFYLPGNMAPEEFVIDLLTKHPSLYRSHSTSDESIRRALMATRGENIHERLDMVARRLGTTPDGLCDNVWANWMETEDGLRELEALRMAVASIQRPNRRA